jgi:phage terminase large subunit-like protein
LTLTLTTKSTASVRSDWPDPKPRVVSCPEFVDRWYEDAVDLAAVAGLELDPWQQWSLRLMLGVRPDNPDRFAAFEHGEIVPRQDGKGAILEARELVGLFRFPWERLLIHTAHEFKTSQEHFYRIAGLVESTPVLSKHVAKIPTAHGKEAILLHDRECCRGARLRFLARSKGSGRGFSGDLVVLDEAMTLPVETMGALFPTMSARQNPQLVYTATAGDGSAEVLADVRERGIRGDAGLAYVEYSAGDPDDHVGDRVNLDDRAEWRRANPAMDSGRITEEFIDQERRALSDEQFARERLCLWTVGQRISVIDSDHWQGLIGDSRKAGEPQLAAIAWDAPPEKGVVSVGLATDRGDGKRHLDLIEYRTGSKWAAPRLAELVRKGRPVHVAYGKNSPAASLHDEIVSELEDKKIDVFGFAGVDVKAACGQFLEWVQEERFVVHNGPHINVLASAVDALRKREDPEGGFVFHRRDTAADISPVMALVFASYALGKPSKKKQRSGEARF